MGEHAPADHLKAEPRAGNGLPFFFLYWNAFQLRPDFFLSPGKHTGNALYAAVVRQAGQQKRWVCRASCGNAFLHWAQRLPSPF